VVKVWICRILIGLVLVDNLQAAVLFMVAPNRFVASFDLAGPAGRIAIQSIGILFLMWCVPYFFATLHPIRYRISHIEACIMQVIAVLLDWLLLQSLPEELTFTPASLGRFILFDLTGLILLLFALWLSLRISPWKKQTNSSTA
jgi:hypothetical protein